MKKFKEMKKGVKIFIVVLAAVIIAAVCGILYLRSRVNDIITGENMPIDTYVESDNYYGGVVEAQETWNITLDSAKELETVYVSEGDVVAKDQPLFLYKVSDEQSQLADKRLQIESLGNDISDYKNQIAAYESQLEGASEIMRLQLSGQIADINASIKQATTQQRNLNTEIAKLQKTIDNATVLSKMDGVVKSISNNTGNTNEPYMVILATGEYRVKANVDELNVSALTEGMEVDIQSRADESKNWKGVISEINTGDTMTGGSNSGGDMSGGMNPNGQMGDSGSATKYTFYVTLESTDGLLLGQHVYVRPVFGTAPVEDEAMYGAGTEENADGEQSTGAEDTTDMNEEKTAE